MDTHPRVNDFNATLRFQPNCRVIEVSQWRKPSIPRLLGAFTGRKKKIARLVVVNVFAMNGVWDEMEVFGIGDNSASLFSPDTKHDFGSWKLRGVNKCSKDSND